MQNEDPVLNKDQSKESLEKTYFFLRNLIKGLIWLGIIVGGYFYLESHYEITLAGVLGPLYFNTTAIYLLFLFSEIVFGLIPPELFMIWALKDGLLSFYIQNVIALSIISYSAGVIGYFIGSRFSATLVYQTIQKRYIGKYEKYFNQFGGFLVVVAALTPNPIFWGMYADGDCKVSNKKIFDHILSKIDSFRSIRDDRLGGQYFSMSSGKTGILLVNLGTPDSTSVADVRKYLREFLMDKRVIDIPFITRWLLVNLIISTFRAPKSAAEYRKLFTERGSPLKFFTEDLTNLLRTELDKKFVIVIRDAVSESQHSGGAL